MSGLVSVAPWSPTMPAGVPWIVVERGVALRADVHGHVVADGELADADDLLGIPFVHLRKTVFVAGREGLLLALAEQ